MKSSMLPSLLPCEGCKAGVTLPEKSNKNPLVCSPHDVSTLSLLDGTLVEVRSLVEEEEEAAEPNGIRPGAPDPNAFINKIRVEEAEVRRIQEDVWVELLLLDFVLVNVYAYSIS